jgi:hypothetical protein
MWVGLFKTVGSNPENLTMVNKRYIEINQRVTKEGCQIKEASATFSKKAAWSKHPKLTLQDSNRQKSTPCLRPSKRQKKSMLKT